ncbi:MAG: cation transporter [Firmicutes bacterium]|nr:cation transporter [Bacillota bacterium]MBQ6841742.1 cation transporter [Bacillota bacterium]
MIELLAKAFIKDHKNYASPTVRGQYGVLCSAVGICLNLLLSLAKFVIGWLAGSMVIIADAVNNLSDAGASIVMTGGFVLAGQQADREHPFGHGRIEYLAGLVVAVLILFAGVETLRSSVAHLLHPAELIFSWLGVGVLLLSIAVKLYMCYYLRRIASRIDSPAMRATATDSLTDSVSTIVALICLLLFRYADINVDAWGGLLVSLLILKAGFDAAREQLDRLLGSPAAPEMVQRIEEIVRSFPEILDIHDLVVHDYGPGRLMASLHAEVDGNGDIYVLHDAVERAADALREQLGCEAVIHMDPIDTTNEELAALKAEVSKLVRCIDPILQLHDFRIVPGPTHTNLIFDVLMPFGFRLKPEQLKAEINAKVQDKHPSFNCIITVDTSYT